MQPLDLRQVAFLLKHHFKVESSLKEQIDTNWIYSSWTKGVYRRKSWKGKVVSWLQTPTDIGKCSRKAVEIFFEAIHELYSSNSDLLKKIRPEMQMKIYDEILRDRLKTELKPLVSHHPEIRKLHTQKQAQENYLQQEEFLKQKRVEEIRQRELRVHSLLRIPLDPNLPPLDNELVESIFNSNLEFYPTKAFEYLKHYLKANPQKGVQGWEEKLHSIQKIFLQDEQWTKNFLSLNPELRKEEILRLSYELCTRIHNENQVSFLVSYGPRRASLEGIFEMLKMLPPNAMESLPAAFREFIQGNGTFDPKAFIHKLLKDFSEELRKNIGASKLDLPNPDKVSPLFYREERQLPTALNFVLPEIIELYLESFLKGGVLGSAANLSSNPLVAEGLQWIAQNGPAILKTNSSEDLIKKIEERLTQLLERRINSLINPIQQKIANMGRDFFSVLPPVILETVGFDTLLINGSILLEFSKNEKGTFDLVIFTLGAASKNHPLHPGSNTHYATLRMTDIDPQKIDHPFVHSLLTKHLEPLWDKKRLSKASDIYQGPLLSLGGQIRKNQPQDIFNAESLSSTPWEMAQAFTIKPVAGDIPPNFEMQLYALLQMCKPHLNALDQTLVIPTLEIGEKLEKALAVLNPQLKKLQGGKHQNFVRQVEATFDEIQDAIKKVQEKETKQNVESLFSEAGLASKISEELTRLGISLERVEGWRSTLRWALGDEIGDVADLFFKEIKSVLPPEEKIPEKKYELEEIEPSGWFLESFASLYLELATRAFEIALSMIGFYYGGSFLILNAPTLFWLGPQILPLRIQKWYYTITDQIKQILVRLLLQTIWSLYVKTEGGKAIQVALDKWKEKVKTLKQTLEGQHAISFELIPEQKIQKKGGEVLDSTQILEPPKNIIKINPFETKEYQKEPLANILTLPYEESKQPILYRLNKWLYNTKIENRDYLSFKYLCKQISTLEIPSLHKKGLWDVVENPEGCFNQFFVLCIRLVDSFPDRVELRSEFTISLFTLYAIMEKLAMRCPESRMGLQQPFTFLEKDRHSPEVTKRDVRVNAIYLIKWLQNPETVIDDAKLLDRVFALGKFFFPEWDLETQKIDEAILDEKAKNLLFSYSYGVRNVYRSHIHSIEKDYLWSLVDEDYSLLAKDFPVENLNYDETVQILFNEGFNFRRKEPLVPKFYSYLRLVGMMANSSTWRSLEQATTLHEVVFGKRGKEDTHVDFWKEVQGYPILSYQPNILFREQSDFEANISKYYKKIAENLNDFDQSLAPDTQFPDRYRYPKEMGKIGTQMEIALRPVFFLQYITQDHLTKQAEMILCNPSEQIVQLLDFYKNQPELLNKEYESEGMAKKSFFETALFAPNVLRKYLKTSPQATLQIGEFLNAIFDDPKVNLQTKFWMIHLGVKLKSYCDELQVKSEPHFPNFCEKLEKWLDPFRANIDELNMFWGLKALALLSQSPQNKQEIASAFAASLIYPKLWNDPIKYSYRNALWKWIPTFKLCMEDRKFRSSLIQALLEMQQIEFNPGMGVVWEEIPEHPFCYKVADGDIRYDLFKNKLTGFPVIQDRVEIVAKELKKMGLSIPRCNDLIAYSDGTVRAGIENRKYTIKLQKRNSEYELDICLEIFGKSFHLVNPDEHLKKYLAVECGLQNAENYWIWLQDTTYSTCRTLRVESKTTNYAILIDEAYGSSIAKPRPELPPQPLPFNKFEKGLSGISRFVQLDTLIVFPSQDNTYIETIQIPQYKLNFKITLSLEGKLEGESAEFPGFYIADRQNHPALKGFGAYLILENHSGKKKVLLPRNQLAPALSWRALKYLGPLSDTLMKLLGTSALASNNFAVPGQNLYEAYDILESKEPLLTHSEPSGLLYLMTLYLMQGNLNGAEQTCRSFEWLCSSQKIGTEIWKQLLPLALAQTDQDDISFYRRRAFSAFSQNQLIHGAELKKEITKSNQVEEVLLLAATLNDLRGLKDNPDPRRALTAAREYFLYQSAVDRIARIIRHYAQLPIEVIQVLDKLGWNLLIEESGILKGFSERFTQVKKEAGIQTPTYVKLMRYAMSLYAAPSDLPQVQIGTAQQALAKGTFDDEGGFGKKLIEWISFARDNRLFDLQALRLEALHKVVYPWPMKKPKLDPLEIDGNLFKKRFLTYYAIARGDVYTEIKKPSLQVKNVYRPQKNERKHSPAHLKEQLVKILVLHKGGWDRQSQILINLLEAVLAYPDFFPRTKELQIAHAKLVLDPMRATQEINQVATWEECFDKMNQIALPGRFVEKILEPVLKRGVFGFGIHQVTEKVRSRLVSLIPGGELVKMAVEATSGALKEFAAGDLISKTEVLWKKDRTPGKAWLSQQGDLQLPTVLTPSFLFALAAGTATFYGLSQLPDQLIASTLGNASTMLQSAATTSSVSTWMLTLAATSAAKVAIAKVFHKPVTLRDITPYPSVVLPSLSWLVKMYNAYMMLPVQEKAVSQKINKPAKADVNYKLLQELDHSFKELLNDSFRQLFVEIPAPNQESKKFSPFEIPQDATPIVRERYEKINKSLAEFYKVEAAKNPTVYILKQGADLTQECVHLKGCLNNLSAIVAQEEKELLLVFNRDQLKPITLDYLHHCVEKQDLKRLAGLSNDLLPDLELALARIDLKRSRLQQLERIVAILENILHLPHKAPIETRSELVEKLAIELKNGTHFKFTEVPSRLLRNFLKFQAATEVFLRETQVKKIQLTLDDPEGNICFIALMAEGKTFFGIPTIAAHFQEKLAMPIFPKQLAGDNMRDVNKQLRQTFQKVTHSLQFHRDMRLDAPTLESILILMNESLQQGEAIQLTKEDALSLRMILRDRMYQYAHYKSSSELGREIVLIKQIGALVREFGVAIVDEAHESYSRRHRLNHPLGPSQTISKERYQVLEMTMRHLLKDKEIKKLIRANKLTKLDEGHYERVIKPRLAEKISRHSLLKLEGEKKRQEFIDFVCDKGERIPSWLEQDKTLFEKVSLIKGTLGVLFPMNFKNRVDVNFGASEDVKKGEFARPSAGNSRVVDSDTIQLPYETLVKTFIMIMSRGLSEKQCRNLLQAIVKRANEEAEKFQIPILETSIYKAVKKFIPSSYFVFTDFNTKPIYEKLRQSPLACLLYTRYFIWNTIRYWTRNIEGNSQLFSGLFKQEITCTGSPYNEGTYPARIKMLHDPTTIGEALAIIQRKCPEDGVKRLESETPMAVLDEILKKYFMLGGSFGSIIDGGALFTGLPNEKVARHILEFCQKNRPDIEGVRFFKEDKEGRDQLFCLLKGVPDPIPAEMCKLPTSKFVDYNDQVHGFGANNCPAKNGLETIGPHHPLYKWMQEVFRVRGLKKEQKLHAVAELILKIPQQQIHFAYTKEVEEMICKKLGIREIRNVTLREIIEYALLNEAELAEEENYPALRDKMAAVIALAIDDKILKTPNDQLKAMISLFREFEEVLVPCLEDDPIHLFGLLKDKIDPKVALKAFGEKLFKIIAKSSSFTDEEKEKVRRDLFNIPFPPLPEKVTGWTKEKGGKLKSGAIDSIGIEQTVQVSSTQTVNQTQQLQQQNELMLQNQQYAETPGNLARQNLLIPLPWPKISKPNDLSWLKLSLPQDTSLPTFAKQILKQQSFTCPFFKVSTLLKYAKDDSLSAIQDAFDERLWMSNNFVQKWSPTPNSKTVDIGSAGQFDLKQVLIHLDESLKIIRMGPLMIHEASMWREILSKDKWDWNSSPIKTFTWDIESQTVQAGYNVNPTSFRNNPDLKNLVNQLKFLDGQVHFQEKVLLENWIVKNNPKKMEQAFLSIYRQRGRRKLYGSVLHNVFIAANEIPYEDLI